jgi:undecaprenyl-phosphate galactose phosphotransferase
VCLDLEAPDEGDLVALQQCADDALSVGWGSDPMQSLTGISAAQVAPLASPRRAHLMGRARSRSLRGQSTQRVVDVVVSGVALAIVAPVMALVALAVRLTSPGPVIFAQTRVGRQGRQFRCLKFRSMRVDADAALAELLATDSEARAAYAADFKLKLDPRITRVGRILRRTSLDELPQLLNVLRGEMSVVGPRPVVPEELWRYGDRGQIVLQVRPGMTGPWQVAGRNDVPYPERVAMDVGYVLHRSVLGDLRILAQTVTYVLGGQPGAS